MPGDEVVFGSEHFYVVSSNPVKTVLLSKYNLLVGNTYNTSTDEYTSISTSTSGYGLQSSTAKGWVNGSNQYIGVVPFSGTNYWDNSACYYTNSYFECEYYDDLKSEYATNGASYSGDPYPYVYKGSMKTSPEYYDTYFIQNNGYTVAYYVEEYVNKLKNDSILPSSATGRLLSMEEYFDFLNIPASFDIDVEQCNTGGKQIAMEWYGYDEEAAEYAASVMCAGGKENGYTLSSFINLDYIDSEYYDYVGVSNVTKSSASQLLNSSFWIGSTYAYDGILGNNSDGSYGWRTFPNSEEYGVRPVIVVNTSDLPSN